MCSGVAIGVKLNRGNVCSRVVAIVSRVVAVDPVEIQ